MHPTEWPYRINDMMIEQGDLFRRKEMLINLIDLPGISQDVLDDYERTANRLRVVLAMTSRRLKQWQADTEQRARDLGLSGLEELGIPSLDLFDGPAYRDADDDEADEDSDEDSDDPSRN